MALEASYGLAIDRQYDPECGIVVSTGIGVNGEVRIPEDGLETPRGHGVDVGVCISVVEYIVSTSVREYIMISVAV